MPPLSMKVVRVVFRWSDDRYMAPMDDPSALGETPVGLESMKDGLELLTFWQLDVIMHYLVSHGLAKLVPVCDNQLL